MKPCVNRGFGCDGQATPGDIECPTCKKFGTYRLYDGGVRQSQL